MTPSKAPTTQSKAPVPKQVSQPSPRSKAPTPQATWNRFTYKKKKHKTEEASQAGQNIVVKKPSTTTTTVRPKPQQSPEPKEEPITFEDIFAKLSKEEEMMCNKRTFRFGLRDNCSSGDDEGWYHKRSWLWVM